MLFHCGCVRAATFNADVILGAVMIFMAVEQSHSSHIEDIKFIDVLLNIEISMIYSC